MIGLALAGGGVKGSYEVGAYLALRKCHIKFDGITGTSIGAFNGAMIASGKINELKNFWQNIDVASIMGFKESFINVIKNDEKKLVIKEGINELIRIIKNHGLDIDGLQNKLKEFNIENSLRKSKIDFGVCTYRLNTHEALEIFKNDMADGKIDDYIIASCYFPIFKPKKIIDDNNYFDGGIHDNCPTNMLLKKGYDKVYEIDLNAIGIKRKKIDKSKVITISPSHKLSHIISLDNEKIKNNYLMGYYDTLKIIKNLLGNEYCFKKVSKWYQKHLTKKYQKDLSEIIDIIEKNMLKDKLTYFHIYSIRKNIKKYYK